MLIAFAVAAHEREQALRLANWITELGCGKPHDCLLCASQAARHHGLTTELEPILKEGFGSLETFVPHDGVEVRWGAPNWDASSASHMMKRVSQHCDWVLKRAFLWLEMDAIPTRASAFDEIEAEYAACGKPFLGARVEPKPRMPLHMSGIAVYPADLASHSVKLRNAGKYPWDLHAASEIVPRAHFTELIQHVYQFPNPCGAVGQWNEKAAIFHQCKCTEGCLIDFLRLTHGKPTEPSAVIQREDYSAKLDTFERQLSTQEKRVAALAKARAAKRVKAAKRA